MLFAFTAASALVPSLLIVWFFKHRDAHPEPSSVLWATFWLGVLSIVPTLIVALPVQYVLQTTLPSGALLATSEAFFTAALPEELFKLCVVLFYAKNHSAFDEPMDGIVYGVVASLGFATLENILYTAQGGLGVALARAFTAVPMHAFCGAIMGYYVGQMKFGPPEAWGRNLLQCYLWPVLIHGLYDAPLLWLQKVVQKAGGELPDSEVPALLLAIVGSLTVLGVAVVWGLILVSRLRAEQLRLIGEGRFILVDTEGHELGPVPVAAFAHTPEPLPAAAHQPSSGLAWLMVVAGGGIASCGGLVLFGGVVALMFGQRGGDQTTGTVVISGFLGLLPLALGLLLFFWGVAKLPGTPKRRSPYRPTDRLSRDELRKRLEDEA